MIEVLVASTILTVIVMMLAMLFQQTSVAWRTGLMRASGFMQLRSYIGAIQRDASAAIDAKNIPAALLHGGGSGDKQSFSANEISFYTLTGVDTNRSLKYVTHYSNGDRQQYRLEWTGSAWRWKADQRTTLLNFLTSGSQNKATISPKGFTFKWPSANQYNQQGQLVSGQNRFPLHLTVEASITQEGKLYEVGAASAGPDRTWNTDDDIRTWVEP